MITQFLGLGMELVGISQGIMMAGGLLGAIIAGTLGAKLTIQKAPLMLLISTILIIPIGLIFLFATPAFFAYIIITAASALTLVAVQMASIQFMTFVQRETPTELTGKVMSLLVILPFVANALGFLVYGVLFEHFEYVPWVVAFITVFIMGLVVLYSQRLFVK